MSEKRGRGQPKFEPTQDQRSQVKLMKALGIPEDRICQTITNPRTKKPVAPMTLARAFAPELAKRCYRGPGAGRQFYPVRDPRQKASAGRSDQKRTGPHDRGDLLRQNQDGLERDGGERAGQQRRQTGSRRRCAAAADRRGRPYQGAERTEGRIGDRLLARTARRSAKNRGRRADPRSKPSCSKTRPARGGRTVRSRRAGCAQHRR